ncbi:NUDIX domain-containing protein [soil metagenome]
MELAKAYLFCPRCGAKVKQEEEFVLLCPHCRFKNYLSPVPCNAAIIENENDEILLVKRANEPHKGEWDLPGGFIMPQESFVESLKREIKEELTCEISVGQIVGAYTDTYLYQDILVPTLGVVAVCQVITGNLKASDDINDYKYFKKHEVLHQHIAFDSIKQALQDYLL